MGHILGALGGLLVGLIVLAGAAGGMYMSFSKSNVATTEENLIILRMQTQQFFNGTNYNGLTNEVAIQAGIIPDAFLRSNIAKNAWGGDITLAPIEDEGQFTIEFTKIPQTECIQLSRFQPDAWDQVDINGSQADTTSVSDVTQKCSDEDNNIIKYTAR